jgi:hypothetical protein
MSTAIQDAIAEIDAKIVALTTTRDLLAKFAVEWPHTAASMTREDPPAPKARRGRKPAKVRGPYKKRLAVAAAGDQAQVILDTLKAHDGSMKPGELVAALKTTPATLRAWMKPLVKSKQVLATGTTSSRRFSLPGRVPKEDL